MQAIVRGNTVEAHWTLHNITGAAFSFEGYAVRLWYACGSNRTAAEDIAYNGNVLTWSFVPDDEWRTGDYDLLLELHSGTRKVVTIQHRAVFALLAEGTCADDSAARSDMTHTLHIVSSCDIARFATGAPTVGDDNVWYINGEPVTDASGNPVKATGPQGEKGDSGVGIVSIEKTGSSGNVDTYTIAMSDGGSTTFTVTNGKSVCATGTTAYWDAQKGLVPEEGAVIIYTDGYTDEEKTYPRIKIGTGNAYVQDLVFMDGYLEMNVDELEEMLRRHIIDTKVHLADGEREGWNKKVSVQPVENETLIFI